MGQRASCLMISRTPLKLLSLLLFRKISMVRLLVLVLFCASLRPGFANEPLRSIAECDSETIRYDARWSMSGCVHQLRCEDGSKVIYFTLFPPRIGEDGFVVRLSTSERMKDSTALRQDSEEVRTFSKFLQALIPQMDNERHRIVLGVVVSAIEEKHFAGYEKVMIRALLAPERLRHDQKLRKEEEDLILAILEMKQGRGFESLRQLAENTSISKTVSASASYILTGIFPEDEALRSIFKNRMQEFRSENKTPEVIWRGGKSEK
jgi:hypothetical protein